jgi:hypothetical protein
MIMLSVMLLLFAGGGVAWLSQAWHPNYPRWISLFTCLVAALLLMTLFGTNAPEEI